MQSAHVLEKTARTYPVLSVQIMELPDLCDSHPNLMAQTFSGEPSRLASALPQRHEPPPCLSHFAGAAEDQDGGAALGSTGTRIAATA